MKPLLLAGMLAIILIMVLSCKNISAPVATSAASPVLRAAPSHSSESEMASSEKRSYLAAVGEYNHFIEHPKGHVYNVYPKERQLELCYLSAQVVMWTIKVPEFASDTNADGEINEWRLWIDIRKHELHC